MTVNMFCPACGDRRLNSDGAEGYICDSRGGCGSEWDTETLEQASWVRCEVPARFYDDHVGRDLPSGVEIRRTQRKVTVDLDWASYTDLLHDAEFYVDMGAAEFGKDSIGLLRSAEATMRALATVISPASL